MFHSSDIHITFPMGPMRDDRFGDGDDICKSGRYTSPDMQSPYGTSHEKCNIYTFERDGSLLFDCWR